MDYTSDNIATACGNREIATKQWMSSAVTIDPPAGLNDKYPVSWTVSSWTNKLNATEYSYFYETY